MAPPAFFDHGAHAANRSFGSVGVSGTRDENDFISAATFDFLTRSFFTRGRKRFAEFGFRGNDGGVPSGAISDEGSGFGVDAASSTALSSVLCSNVSPPSLGRSAQPDKLPTNTALSLLLRLSVKRGALGAGR
jgi:hypothetical protein